MTDDNTKTCTKCGVTYPATVEFWHQYKRNKDGLKSRCKVCRCEYNRKRRAANPEKLREQARKRHAANPEKAREQRRNWCADNSDKLRERNRKWNAANPEYARNYHRKYYAADPEKFRERRRKYRAANPDKVREYNDQRRALENGLPYDFPAWMERRALDYWHGCCAICGRQLKDLFDTHKGALDHWIALTDKRPDNPGTVATNMIPLCHGIAGCNNKKFNKDPYEWINQEHGTRKAKPIIAAVETFFDRMREQDA